MINFVLYITLISVEDINMPSGFVINFEIFSGTILLLYQVILHVPRNSRWSLVKPCNRMSVRSNDATQTLFVCPSKPSEAGLDQGPSTRVPSS